MRNPPRLHLHRILLTLILGVAVLLSGFAHRMPAPQDTALTSFANSGGDLADICGTGGDTRMATTDCVACHLVEAAVLADPVLCLVVVERVITASILSASKARIPRAPRDPALGGRAPPLA